MIRITILGELTKEELREILQHAWTLDKRTPGRPVAIDVQCPEIRAEELTEILESLDPPVDNITVYKSPVYEGPYS